MRHRFTTNTDLTEFAFADAVDLLKVEPHRLVIYCSHSDTTDATSICVKYGCRVVYVPDEILLTPDSWGVGLDENFIWSTGA